MPGDKIDRCPFCGGYPAPVIAGLANGVGAASIYCGCGASVSKVGAGAVEDIRALAIAAWNRRANAAEAVATSHNISMDAIAQALAVALRYVLEREKSEHYCEDDLNDVREAICRLGQQHQC